MSETTVDNNDGYPKKIRIVIDGQERSVYDTNNMFGYLSTILRIRDKENAGEEPAGMLETVLQDSDLRPYFEAFIDGQGELNRAVVEQARIANDFNARLYSPDRSAEDEADYRGWVQGVRDTDEFRLMLSDALESMAPALEADGRQPVELTI